jgi:hypothetical protein
VGEVQANDVLEAVGRTPVASVSELESALEHVADREMVLLKVRRAETQRARIVVWRRLEPAAR